VFKETAGVDTDSGFMRGDLAEHVWEHLTLEEGSAAAFTGHTYLASGG